MNAKDILSLFDRWITRGGAVAGIAAAVVLMTSEFNKPSPPDLSAIFLLSHNDSINIARPLSERPEQLQFPLGLEVHNHGGQAAHDVQLTFLSDNLMELDIQGMLSEKFVVRDDEGFKTLHKVSLGDLNPGESKIIDDNLWCNPYAAKMLPATTGNDEKKTILAAPIIKDVILSPSHLEVRLSSKNASMRTQHLYVAFETEASFNSKQAPFLHYENGMLSYREHNSQ